MRDIDIAGVLIAPVALDIAIAVVVFLVVVRPIMIRLHLERWSWDPALLDVSVLALMIAGLVLVTLP